MTGAPDAPPPDPTLPRRRWARDPRVWLGGAVTALTLWLALRDVSFRALAQDMGRANLPLLLLLSVPAHIAVIALRALRWRHLTDAIAPMSRGALFRATAVGFMANNVFPLRMGELIRAWYLARETGTRGAAVLATVLLERVIDAMAVVLMATVILGAAGSRGGGPASLLAGAPIALLLLPIGFVLALRFAPERATSLATGAVRPFAPTDLLERIQDLLRTFSQGLGSLRGGRHLFWIFFHSALIWLVVSMVPFLAGILALGIDLGSPARTLEASYVTLVAVGFAVAFPSAPGFFGPYHYACRLALSRFGVPEALALAVGTLVHAVFWVTVIALGLVVLRLRKTPLQDIETLAGTGKDPSQARR